MEFLSGEFLTLGCCGFTFKAVAELREEIKAAGVCPQGSRELCAAGPGGGPQEARVSARFTWFARAVVALLVPPG